MKRIAGLLFALLTLLPWPEAAAAKWDLIYENDRVQLYVDTDSITYRMEESTGKKDKKKLVPNRDFVTLWTKWAFTAAERKRLAKSEHEGERARADITEMLELHMLDMREGTILRSMTVTYDALGQPNHDGLTISGTNLTKAAPGTLGSVELDCVKELCKKQDKKIIKRSIEEKKYEDEFKDKE